MRGHPRKRAGESLRIRRRRRRGPSVPHLASLGVVGRSQTAPAQKAGTCSHAVRMGGALDAGIGRIAGRMDFDEFTGTVQHRLEFPGTGETLRAIRATLMTLGERIPAGAAEDLAASLPMEIRWYMTGAVREHGQRFDWREFVERVSEIEKADGADAAYHARVIVDLVASQVPKSDFRQLRDQLPEGDEDWGNLFEVVDAGGWSESGEE